MLIAHDTLIMAVDGARMSLFRNKGNVRLPSLELLAEERCITPPTAELGHDQPGRAFQSSGNVRGAYQATDLHQLVEDAFTREMAEMLTGLIKDDDTKAILIAPPHVMGLIRKYLPDNIRKQLIAEIDKDYAGRPATEIAELLDKYET